MQGLPLVTRKKSFTVPGFSDVTDVGLPLPLHRVPNKWSMQVTAYDANGNVVSPAPGTTWNVTLQRSLNGKAYDDDAGAMLAHSSGANSIGAVVSTDGNLRPASWVRTHVVSLVLGAGVHHIDVEVIGER